MDLPGTPRDVDGERLDDVIQGRVAHALIPPGGPLALGPG